METDILLYGAVLPALCSFMLVIVARRPWRAGIDPLRTAPWRWGGWGAAAAIAFAVLTTFHGLRGVRLRPIDAADWLPHVIIAGAIVGLLFSRWRAEPIARAAARMLLSLGAVSLVLWWKFRVGWTPITGALWLALGAAASAAHWHAVESCLSSARVGTGLFIVGAATAAAAVCLGMTGSAFLAQLAGAAALTLGVCFILLPWRRAGAPGPAAAVPLSFFTAGALVLGMSQARLPWISAVLLALAPMATALAIVLTERSRGGAMRTALPIALGLAIIGGAIGASAANFEPKSLIPADGGHDYEYDDLSE